MSTVIDGLRQIVGAPNFYDAATGAVYYDAMIEYLIAAFLVVVVVGSFFRLISKVACR